MLMVFNGLVWLFIEIGEFQLPLLVLSTDSSSRMLMETDANNTEVYIKISKSYQLKSSDSVLTELGYDDINRLETPTANCLLQTFIRSYLNIGRFSIDKSQRI